VPLFICNQRSSGQDKGGKFVQDRGGATGSDWPSYGGTVSAWRYSALNQINASNVKKLVPVWAFQTGDYQNGLQSTPIVLNGVLYLTSNRDDVFALDGATGRLIWEYKYQALPGSATRQNKGVAVSDGEVFVGTSDSYLVALDQKTGKEIWKVASDDTFSCRCGLQAAPLVVKDKVIVGGGGSRGYLTAFNASTGRIEWRFFSIPGPGEKGNETWPGDSWKTGSAKMWTTGSYDSQLNLIYWGTGDPSPMIYGGTREGDNLYSASVVAVDADTGKLRWYFQDVPHDTWDFDSTWEMVLIDRELRGSMRKLLVHFGKGGYTYVLDRETGEFLNAYPVNDYIDWVKGISDKGELVGRRDPVVGKVTSICPGNLGGKSWNQTAYSPRTGLIYSPSLEMCQNITLRPPDPNVPGDRGSATFVFTPPPGLATAYGHLDALDPVTGKKQWTYPYRFELFASILATAGDLVFTGDPEGYFFALDARSGKKLWSFQTGAGHRGGPVTYMADGRQYVATPTGWGGTGAAYSDLLWPEAEMRRLGSTLFVFALPEEWK
jgi:PQQ-dependent dehydrogenase (methanol/ethanol family)